MSGKSDDSELPLLRDRRPGRPRPGGLEVRFTDELRYDPTGVHKPPEDEDCQDLEDLDPVASQTSTMVVPIANDSYNISSTSLSGGGATGSSENIVLRVEILADG